MFYPTERKTVAQALALTNSAVNRYTTQLTPDGCGWTKIILNFHATIDWTNANVVDRRGLYRYLKAITLRTSRGETIYDGVCGQALYITNSLFNHVAPVHDVILGADGTYDGIVELYLWMPFLNRGEDVILDTSRYSQIELSITTGSVLDFLDDADGESVAVTMDIEVEKTLSALSPDGKSKPVAHAYFAQRGPFVYSAQNYFDIESSVDLGLFGFAVKVAATGVTCPFDGAGVDNLTSLDFADSVRPWVNHAMPWGLKQELHNSLHFEAQNIYLATPATTEQVAYPLLGVYPYWFVKNGSINEHYSTGKKSQIRVTYTDGTTTDIGNIVYWGMRALR
jgi:hypothetical protein